MDRRKALTFAGTAAMVVAAGGIAMAANFGVLGVAGAGDDSVGTLDTENIGDLGSTTTTAPPQVVIIDQYDIVPTDSGPSVSDDQSIDGDDHQSSIDDTDDDGPTSAPPAGSPEPTVSSHSDDEYDDEYEDEHEDEHEVEHEEEHEEHEDD